MMETYTFYSGYTDIYGMYNSQSLSQFEKRMNPMFNPPYISINIPVDMTGILFLEHKKFIMDKKSIHSPSRIVKVPVPRDNKGNCVDEYGKEMQNILDEYDAISYDIEDDMILLDVIINSPD